MKNMILLVLIGLASLAYNPSKAVSYARKYCKNYNPYYSNYAYIDGESSHFVSQCMIAGGMDFKTCSVSWIDSQGCLLRVGDLKSCLQQKGWKHSTSRPNNFKAGYPIFTTSGSHAMLATGIYGSGVYFCAHDNDRCDATINSGIEYYYE